MEPSAVQFQLVLMVRERAPLDRIQVTIPADEWQQLQAFVAATAKLRDTSFVRAWTSGETTVHISVGVPIEPATRPITDDEVLALLLRMRPFLLSDAQSSFTRIRSLLARRLDHPALRKVLGKLKRKFLLHEVREWMLPVEGRAAFNVQLIMDWLNAFEYHRDAKNIASIEARLAPFRQSGDGRAVIVFGVAQMVDAVLHLGTLVDDVMHIASDPSIGLILSEDCFTQQEP